MKAPRPRLTDDDRLHAFDSVHADDFCVRHHRKLSAAQVRGSAEAPAKALHASHIAGTQHDQHATLPLHSVHSRGESGPVVAGHDEIDGSGHRVAPEEFIRGGRRRDLFEDSVGRL